MKSTTNPFWRGWLVSLAALLLLAVAGPAATSAQIPAPAATPAGPDAEAQPASDAESDEADVPTLAPQDASEPGDADEADGATFDEQAGGGGAKNIVKLNNRVDGRMRVRGNVQLSRIHGQKVGPINLAYARSSCTGCSTFAVALQIAVYRQGAKWVAPQNVALALNVNCRRCVTVAHAYQYAIPVEDPSALPERVDGLVRRMNQELRGIQADSASLTPPEAEARLEAVIVEFQDLAANLTEARDERTDDSDEPSPTPTGTLLVPIPAAPEPTITPTVSGTVQPSGTSQSTGADQSTGTGQAAASDQSATAQPTAATPVPSRTTVP